MSDKTVSRLAAAFAGKLRASFGEEQWQVMRERNATPINPGTCASHDFADANEVMAAAFVELKGRDLIWPNEDGSPSPESDADFALWNSAWDEAKREYLTHRPVEQTDKPH